MFGSKDRPDDGSTRVTPGADHPHGTTTDADVTSRMTGTGPRHAATDAPSGGVVTDSSRPAERFEHRQRVLPAKTSAAAAFALVFGVSALFSALTGILAPAAVVLGLIAVVLGVVGRKMARRDGVTGKGVALGGLLLGLLGLLLGAAVLAGAAVLVNDQQRLDQLQNLIDDARSNLPSGSEVVEQVPGN